VTNTGNDNNTFSLGATSGAGGNTWTATLIFDANGDGTHDAGETTVTNSTGLLTGGSTYKFFVVVSIPADTVNGQTDNTVLSVIGSADAGAGDDTSDTVMTTAQAPTMTITKAVRNFTTSPTGPFTGTANAKPGETLEYQIKVENTGAVDGTSVVLTDNDGSFTTFVSGSIWIGSNATDSNGSGNINSDDDNSGSENCTTFVCGQGSVNAGNVSAYLGNAATETTGGTLRVGDVVYVYFRVTVD